MIEKPISSFVACMAVLGLVLNSSPASGTAGWSITISDGVGEVDLRLDRGGADISLPEIDIRSLDCHVEAEDVACSLRIDAIRANSTGIEATQVFAIVFESPRLVRGTFLIIEAETNFDLIFVGRVSGGGQETYATSAQAQGDDLKWRIPVAMTDTDWHDVKVSSLLTVDGLPLLGGGTYIWFRDQASLNAPGIRISPEGSDRSLGVILS